MNVVEENVEEEAKINETIDSDDELGRDGAEKVDL